jgi:hypothetical protein
VLVMKYIRRVFKSRRSDAIFIPNSLVHDSDEDIRMLTAALAPIV